MKDNFLEDVINEIDEKLMLAEAKPRDTRASDAIKYSQRAFEDLDVEGLRSCLYVSGEILTKKEDIIDVRYLGFDTTKNQFVYGFIWQDITNNGDKRNDKDEPLNYAINKAYIYLTKTGLVCGISGSPEEEELHIKTAKIVLKNLKI